MSVLKSLIIFLALISALLIGYLAKPTEYLAGNKVFDLSEVVPGQFGQWKAIQRDLLPIVDPGSQSLLNRIYDQTLERTYIDQDGNRIMLSIAYGRDQRPGRNGNQAHQPEYCYPAQGFKIDFVRNDLVFSGETKISVRRLIGEGQGRIEPITYWMIVGDKNVLPGMSRKKVQYSYGFRGEIPDGILIRVSSIGEQAEKQFKLHDIFIAQLIESYHSDAVKFIGEIAD